MWYSNQANINLFKENNRNSAKRGKTCLKMMHMSFQFGKSAYEFLEIPSQI